MFVCAECSAIFEEPKQCYGQQLEYFGTPCRESRVACPYCGEACVSAFRCDLCGEYIVDDYVEVDGVGKFCENHCRKRKIGE